MRAAQRAQRGEEQERPPAAGFEHRPGRFHHRVGERRIVRVARQPGRQIEERLLGEAERTFPAARLGLGHAELAREVPEVLTDGERRRGEDPGTRMIIHLAAEELARVQRGDMEVHRLPHRFGPAHVLVRIGLEQASQHCVGVGRSPAAGPESFRTLGLCGERGIEHLERGAQLDERLGKPSQTHRLRPGEARRRIAERQAQVARRLVDPVGERLELGRAAARGAQLCTGIARQLDQLAGGEAVAEEEARRFGKLVRLVEDHGVAGRQELAHAFLAQHHVGKEEMVVDHHDVGGERVSPRAHHEAVAVVGAALPEAVVARRAGLRPDRRVLGHFGEVGAIAAHRAGGEALDAPELRRLFGAGRALLGLSAPRR